MLKHLLIKPKNIFECFSIFWKVFWFEKFHKNPKISNSAFLWLKSGLLKSRKRLRKILNFFNKLIFQFFQPEAFVTLSRLVGEYKSQPRKRLRNFFQNMGLRVFGNSFASQLSRKKCVFCKNKVKSQTVFQNFSLSLTSRVCLFRLSLSQNHHFHSINLHCSHQSSLQIKEKVWVFTPFYFISSLKHSISRICWFCWDIEILSKNMGFCSFWWNWYMGFVENDGIILVFHVSIKIITCSCIILCFVLWCVYHFVDKMSI